MAECDRLAACADKYAEGTIDIVDDVANAQLIEGFGYNGIPNTENNMRIPDIKLTEQEADLLSQVVFDSGRHDAVRASLGPMSALFELLLEREAIPEVRLLYFTDPERNPGGRGKSRQQIFEKNGTSGAEICGHGNFIKYLRYFVYGPDLPLQIIEKFKDARSSSGYLTDGDINDLIPFARAAVRSSGLDPHEAAKEIHKLALECGAAPSSAESIPRLIRAMR